MKTLLIPIDFTDTALNTLDFAASWSQKYGYDRIILLKSFYDSVFEDVITSAEYVQFNQEHRSNIREEITEQLHAFCVQLAQKTGIKVLTATSELPLLRAILEVINTEDPELIIVGSDHLNHSSNSPVSDNVTRIARLSPIRVLVVPAAYKYEPVKEALVPINLQTANTFSRLNYLTTNPQWHETRLKVLYVDARKKHLQPGNKFGEAESSLHQYLANFDHQLYYSDESNIIDGILNFSKINPVQLIVALPGKYSFLYTLTHRSISEALYRNAHEPVLILK